MDLACKQNERAEISEFPSADGGGSAFAGHGIYLMQEAFESSKFWKRTNRDTSAISALGFPQLELDF